MTCLDHLGVKVEKRLKCCAHIVLAEDNAIDSVLKDVEMAVGQDRLISSSMGTKALTSYSSIIY